MKKLLRKILLRPVLWLANRYSSKPDKLKVHQALSELYENLVSNPGKKGPIIAFNTEADSFVIFSDQHKGAKDGSDDFAIAEMNYLTALDYYNAKRFQYINLGDGEEFWENSLAAIKKHNAPSFEKERLFLNRNAFTKVFGNHDLYWDNDPLSAYELEKIYGRKVRIYEGVILTTIIKGKSLKIFLTHGHQGDTMSDGNAFSKWFVSNVWAPLQSYLGLNPNTPAYDDNLKTEHNKLMYEWSAQQSGILLITGHTHQPVFDSLTHLERLYQKLYAARKADDGTAIKLLEAQIHVKRRQGETIPDFTAYKSTYFNSGCCCFNDGDITGIEIAEGMIRLIKWDYKEGIPQRLLLEEKKLEEFII